MLKFYTNPICPFSQQISFILNEKKIKHERFLIPLSNEILRCEKFGMSSNISYKDTSLEELKRQKKEYMDNISPTGELSTIIHNGKTLRESDVVVDYLDQVFENKLTPQDPYEQAQMKIFLKKFYQNRPTFFELLGNQDPSKDQVLKDKLDTYFKFFTESLSQSGPFYLGDQISLVEIVVAPFFYRFSINWKHYRGYNVYEGNEEWRQRFKKYVDHVCSREAFKVDCPSEDLVKEAFECMAHGNQINDQNKLCGRGISKIGQ